MTLLPRVVAACALLAAVPARSGADGWLVIEAPAALAISEAQSGLFRTGVMPALGLYTEHGALALGARLRAGILRNGPAPSGNLSDPGLGGLGTAGVALRLAARGAWLEGVAGGGLTGSDVVPALEAGVGWDFATGPIDVGPSVRYVHVVSRDAMSALGSADLVLLGVAVRFGRGHGDRAPSVAASAPQAPAQQAPAQQAAPVQAASGDGDSAQQAGAVQAPSGDGDSAQQAATAQAASAHGASAQQGATVQAASAQQGPAQQGATVQAASAHGASAQQGPAQQAGARARDTGLDSRPDSRPDSRLDRDPDRIADRDAGCATDSDGCELADQIFLLDDRIVLEERVLFDVDRARVRSGGRALIATLVRVWAEHPRWRRISIEGHTDVRGSDEYNLELSRRRAERVRDVFVRLGADAGKIDVVGHGRTQPRDPGTSDEAHQRNRRVEFVIDREAADTAGRPW